MKKYCALFVALLYTLFAFSQEQAVDPKAKSILEKAISAFESKKGVVANFTIKVENTRNGQEDIYKGSALLKGERFQLNVQDVVTYFDGKTQCVYMQKEKEVTISHPDKEDLKEINPILLMRSAKTEYKMRYLGSVMVNAQEMDKIELYPNDLKSPYSILTVLVSKKDLSMNTMTLKGKNGIVTQLYVTKIENKPLEDALFVFDTKKHPGVEVVDLR